ncbi:MAG: lysine--tRNA ligase, partial [Alistipes sp.]|nr:lysine--tRNA ligase [Alistipes sp.]
SGMGMGIDRLTMFMTGQTSIQDVLFFPTMRPEKKVVADAEEVYTEAGVPAEWVETIQKMGYITLEAFANTAKSGGMKLFNDLCGFNKKNKLGLATAGIKAWIESQKEE